MHRRVHPIAALRWALDATLVALVVVVVMGLVVARVLPALGHEAITINGSSMEPTIPLGSTIVLGRVDPDGIQVGQVVSIRVPDRGLTYTHRVVEVVHRPDGPYLRTRGDNNPTDDPVLVPASWAIGTVDVAIPGLGYLLHILSTVRGMAMIVGLAASLYLAARLLEELERDAVVPRRRATTVATSRSAAPGASAGELPGMAGPDRP